jgi:hypothetical protein
MSDWSSYEDNKEIADKWRQFLTEETQLDEGWWDDAKAAAGKASDWLQGKPDEMVSLGPGQTPTTPTSGSSPPEDIAPPEGGSPEASPQGAPTYIPRPKLRALSTAIKTAVSKRARPDGAPPDTLLDDKIAQQLQRQVALQLKANNIKFGTAPTVAEGAAAPQHLAKQQYDAFTGYLSRLAANPSGYFSNSMTEILKTWRFKLDSGKDRFQGWSSKQLKSTRALLDKVYKSTEAYATAPDMNEKKQEKAKQLLPVISKFAKRVDAVRKGQRKTDFRRYGLDPATATDQDLRKAQHAQRQSALTGKNATTNAGTFMISGLATYMQQRLKFDKKTTRAIAGLIAQFVKGNTKLKLSEDISKETK